MENTMIRHSTETSYKSNKIEIYMQCQKCHKEIRAYVDYEFCHPIENIMDLQPVVKEQVKKNKWEIDLMKDICLCPSCKGFDSTEYKQNKAAANKRRFRRRK